MKTVAIVDDDVYIGDMLEEVLAKSGYRPLRAYSGSEALLLLQTETPDLILLDLMLPGVCGEKVMEKIKGIPVIVISAKNDTDEKVKLLLGGAADYISKPFDIKELLARITVALRDKNAGADIITKGGITLNSSDKTVRANGAYIKLTRTEFAILKYLMINENTVISKSKLLDRISADTPDCTESSLKIHISNLRKKLRGATGCDPIESVWGVGYIFTGS